MKIAVLQDSPSGFWEVWVTLDGHDPVIDAFGFIVGVGITRDAAVSEAVAELEQAVATLKAQR